MNVVPWKRAATASRRIAVIGSGISGASCAWALSSTCDVCLYESEARAGGHSATVDVDYAGKQVAVDTGFIVYNEHNYTELTRLFAHLGVSTHASDMSLSISLDGGRREWSGRNFASLFARRRNAFSPSFLWMLREILRFNRQCLVDQRAGRLAGRTIGEYLVERGFSTSFRDDYLVPMAAAIWSTPKVRILDFPASSFVAFFDNHRLVHQDRPVWRTVTGGSRSYLAQLLKPARLQLRTGARVTSVSRDALGATVTVPGCEPERFDAVVIATHTDQALALLSDATQLERRLLASISYRPNRVVLHRDPRLMPRRRGAWASWNYMRSSADGDDAEVCVTYWMNRLQGIEEDMPLFVSLNPALEPRQELVFGEWGFSHPQFDAVALSAQARLDEIQGGMSTWFAGAWTGYGFHEDGLRSGLDAAQALGGSIPWSRARERGAIAAPLAAE